MALIEADFTIVGEKELLRTMKSLGVKTKMKLLRPAVAAGAKPIVKAAKRNAPVETGLLKIALGTKVILNKSKQVAFGVIGARTSFKSKKADKIEADLNAPRKPSNYAHLVEFGAKSHFVIPKRREALKISDSQFASKVEIPRIPHKPFLRPAFNSNKRRAQNEIMKRLWQGIKKDARRVAKK